MIESYLQARDLGYHIESVIQTISAKRRGDAPLFEIRSPGGSFLGFARNAMQAFALINSHHQIAKAEQESGGSGVSGG